MTCTRTFHLPTQSGPTLNGAMMTCWRVSKKLTVSLQVLAAPRDYEDTAAAAVDQVWALQR